MGLLEAVLALIGLVAVIGAIALWHMQRLPVRPPEADLAAPYREALHTAARLQNAALDLEQQLYVEKLRYAESNPGGER